VAKIDFLNQQIVRSYGTFPHPNLLGGFGSVVMVLLLIFRDSFKKIPAWILYILLMLITLGLFVTFSRSALLGVTAGILLFFIFTVRKRNILPSLIGVCCILLALSFLFPWNRFQEATQENSQRLEQYQQSFQLMRLYPLGTGLGNYLIALQTLPVQTNDWEKQPVHNTFLEVSSELGVMTAIFLICLLLSLCCKLLFSPHKNLLALLATISIPLITDHYFFTSFQGIILLGLVLGIILQQSKRDHPVVETRLIASLQTDANVL
jgi:O-antigen ligase